MKLELNEYYGVSLELVAPDNSTNGQADLGVLLLMFDSSTGRITVDWNSGEETVEFDAYPKELSLDINAKATVEYHDVVSIDLSFETFDDYQSYRNDPEEYLLAHHEEEIVESLQENSPDDVEIDIRDVHES